MKVPVLSAPLIMGSFRASGSSPCTCPSNCSSVSKTGVQLMPYIQSDRSETANGRSLHLITLWHRREPMPLTPVRCSYLVTTRWFCSFFLFPASIHTNAHCSAFKMGKGNQPLAQVQQSSVWHSQKTSDTWRRWCLIVLGHCLNSKVCAKS